MIWEHLELLPGGKVILIKEISHQKYCLIIMESVPSATSTEYQRAMISNLKEAASMSSISTIKTRRKVLNPSSKELKWVLWDQMILHKFRVITIARRKCESSFRWTTSSPIVFSIDVDEGQILKAERKLFCFSTPVKEFSWGESSQPLCPIYDDLWVTEYMG